MAADAAPETWIATWLVHDSEATGTFMPNVNASSAERRTQEIYARCVLIFFATSIRQNPSFRHVLFTNADVALVDDVDIIAAIRGWGVEIVRLEPEFHLPAGAVSAFANQFYVLGIINRLAQLAPDDCRVILLDADCVVLKPLGPMSDAIGENGLLGLPLGDDEVNGSSLDGMQKALDEFAPARAHEAEVVYWGGELFAATGRWCRIVDAEIPALWRVAVAHAFEPGWIKEEAHMLSVLYAARAPDIADASSFIRRVWTAFKLNDAGKADLKLAIWHVPAEKSFGLRRIYPLMADPSSFFWRGSPRDDWRILGRYLGVPRRSLRKLVADVALKASARLPSIRARGKRG